MTLLKTNNLQSIKYSSFLRRYNWSMTYFRNFMRNLCDAVKRTEMSCKVDAFPFHAQANYGTLSIDFGQRTVIGLAVKFSTKM